jgi:hypothetical protein
LGAGGGTPLPAPFSEVATTSPTGEDFPVIDRPGLLIGMKVAFGGKCVSRKGKFVNKRKNRRIQTHKLQERKK